MHRLQCRLVLRVAFSRLCPLVLLAGLAVLVEVEVVAPQVGYLSSLYQTSITQNVHVNINCSLFMARHTVFITDP